MQKPLVSIVIPIYNAEKYLNTTLDCIIKQTYRELEIICVDDGSTDKSLDIVKNWKKNDSRLVFVSQSNQYAGVARNRGMDIAKGKYIIFLDADDYFKKNMIASLVKISERNNTDIIFFDYYVYDGKKYYKSVESAKAYNVSFGKVITPIDIANCIFQVDHGMPWNKFYRADFLRESKVYFPGLQNSEDEFFSRMTEVKAKRLLFYNKRLVYYRINNSDSLQGGTKNCLDFVEAIASVYDGLKSESLYDIYRDTYQKLVSYIVFFRLKKYLDNECFADIINLLKYVLWEKCEFDESLVDNQLRNLFRVLRRGDPTKVKYEIKQTSIENKVDPLMIRIKKYFRGHKD